MKKLTMEQIAENLGVSKTTVSQAISGKGRISESSRERVRTYVQLSGFQKALHELNYEVRSDLILDHSDCGVQLEENLAKLIDKEVDVIISMSHEVYN